MIDALLPVSVIRKILPRKLGVSGVGQAEWAPPDASAQDLTERSSLTMYVLDHAPPLRKPADDADSHRGGSGP